MDNMRIDPDSLTLSYFSSKKVFDKQSCTTFNPMFR